MRHRLAIFLLVLLLVAVAWVSYAPGLHGSFLFDDFGNLPALGATGPVDNWPNFWRYITSGIADPTGRPLTLLTFLLDGRDWPTDPYPFKRTNLVLHLLNGVLLVMLLQRLGRIAFSGSDKRRINLAAVVGAGFWLLHPLFGSTTLYIVQREAMLPATFTLLGLLAWLHGRSIIARGHIWYGLVWIAIGLGACTILGVLSKANGILLPTLALVVEFVLLSTLPAPVTSEEQHRRRVYRRSMWLFGWLPTALVAGYLLEQGWIGLTQGISSVRPWTLGQRLLTEPRVLLDYLDLLWIPRPFTPGLFNDHIQASTSLWSPASTLPALLAILAMVTASWLLRRRWPALALAILFYFVGQSLESSTVALELFFEHRNYLPAMLMFWPLALWLCSVHIPSGSPPVENQTTPGSAQTGRSIRMAKLALAALILSGLSLMTHARASLWGNSREQALLWARMNPESARAQANAAQVEMGDGHPELAVNRLRAPLANSPSQIQLALNLFGAECQMGRIGPSTLAAAREALRTTRDPGSLLVSWFERAMDQVAQTPCPQLTYATLGTLIQATEANPHLANNPGRQQDIHYLLGLLALKQGHANSALTEFNRALDEQVRTSAALKQAALLGAAGFPQHGLSHLDHLATEPAHAYKPGFGMQRIHAWVLQRQHYWQKELTRLRATLRDDAAKQARKTL